MDTSTPVRNHNVNDESNVSDSCDQNDSEIFLSDSPPSLNQLSLVQQPDLSLSQNDDTFMGKSQRVLPFSPIAGDTNVPSTLLPLLDTPDFRWSTSILSNNHFQTLHPEENSINSPGEQLIVGDESENYSTILNRDYIREVKSPMRESNIVESTPKILLSPVLTQCRRKKVSTTVNKNLFPTPPSTDRPEEQNSVALINSFLIGDETLNALYLKDSSYVEANPIGEQHLNFSLNSTFDLVDRKVDAEILEKRCKKPFFYPVEIVSKCTVHVDDIYESVLPLESNARLPVRSTGRRPFPKGMVPFSQLDQLPNEYDIEEEFTFPVSQLDRVTRDAELSFPSNAREKKVSWARTFPARFCRIISNDRDLYTRLKAYFEYYRIEFAKMVFETNRRSIRRDFGNAIHLSQWCQLPYLWNTTINARLNGLLQMSGLTFAFVGEFFDFFRCYFYLVYNSNISSRRIALSIAVDDRLKVKKRKRATLLSDETERIEESSQVVENSHDSPERKVMLTSHSELTNDVRVEFIDENIVESFFEDFDITVESLKDEESVLTVKSNSFSGEKNIATKGKSVIRIIDTKMPQTSSSMKANSRYMKNGFTRMNAVGEKSFPVNQKSLRGAKKLFDDLTNAELNNSVESRSVANKPKSDGFGTAAGKSIGIDEESMAQARKLLEDISADEFLDLYSPETKKDGFDLKCTENDALQSGFSTAAGNSIRVKEEALAKAKKFMDDAANEQDTDFIRPTRHSDTLHGLSNTNVEHSRERDFKTEIFPPSTDLGFPGFSSASGKSIKIDGKLLEKARKMMNDAANEECADFVRAEQPTTATVDSVQRATSNDSSTSLSDFTNARGFTLGGFSTAGGKSIKIDDEKLMKAQKMLDEVTNDEDSDFTRTELARTTVADDGIRKIATNDSSMSLRNCANIRGCAFGGFNTAGGKSIKIDDERLVKAQKMFDEVTNEDGCDSARVERVRTMAAEDGIRPSASNDSSKLLRNSANIRGCELGGFNTAGGKSIKIDDERLVKAQKMFDEVTNADDSDFARTERVRTTVADDGIRKIASSDSSTLLRNGANIRGCTFGGFNTAGGKSIQIDDKSLTRAKKLFDDVVNEDIAAEESSNTGTRFDASIKVESIRNVGFSTAGGKSIAIDDDLVSQARRKFEDDWSSTKSSDLNSSACIYGAKSVGRDDKIENKIGVPSSSGFSTAAGRSIKVDEKLVAEAREKLGDVALHDDEKRKAEPSTSDALTRVPSSASPVLLEDANTDGERCETAFETIDSSNTFDIVREISESASAIFSNASDVSDAPAPTSGGSSEKPIQRSRASSPIFDSSKGGRKRKNRQKRRSQCALSLTPLDVTYVRKEGGDSGEKSSTESVLRMFNDSFAQKCGKRKDAASNLSYPAAKKIKESDRTATAAKRRKAAIEQQIYVENKDKENRGPRTGSYAAAKIDGGRKSLVEVVDGRPRMYSIEQLLQLGVKRSVINVNAKNAQEFVFTSDFLRREHLNDVGMNYGDECVVIPNEHNEVGVEQLQTAFLASPGVDPRLISVRWIRNHYRWIVWKLASVEKSFPTIFGGSYLTIDRVLVQLKFRYDWEVDRCKRSALKKILECDESASKTMVLCVADIATMEKTTNEYRMELTDGWYSVGCSCDAEMNKLIVKKKVSVGTKLVIANAELLGAAEGYDPLELPEEVRLRISTNSVRRARWNATLGFHFGPSIRAKELKTVLPSGGVVAQLTATVARIYPFLYMEKRPDGSTELYNEKVRTKRSLEWERKRQSFLERTISQVTMEVQKENGVNVLSDSDEMRNESDQIVSENCRYEKQEKMRRLIEERVHQKLPDELKSQNHVRRLLKVRLTNVDDEVAESSALLTIWNPSEDCASLLLENRAYAFHNLMASGCRHGELQLSNSRMTRYERTSLLPTVVRYQRRFTPIADLKADFVSPFDEIDTVGVVIDYENVTNESNAANEIVYLADLEQNIVAVTFKSNSKSNGFEELLKPKRIVAGVDLRWKGGSLHWKIPVVFACDYSYFTHTPRFKYLHAHLDDFETYFRRNSVDEFVEICKKRIEDVATVRNEPAATSTPVKMSSRGETSGNVSVNTSVSVSNVSLQANNSWNGSTSSRNAISRMEQLRRYGEPPPLSPICLNARPKRAKLSVQTRVFKTNNDKI